MSVYLDWAATTPPDPEIIAEASQIAVSAYGNPSSVHTAGKTAASLLAEARERCAKTLGVKSDTIIFTSGGTESDHLPMLSLLQRPVRGSIAISAIEHPAIIEQARMLELLGWKTLVIPVTREGFVTPEAVLATIREDTAYVAVMAVNNETGAIQPVREIAQALLDRCAGKKKPHFHVDAVQAAGKMPLQLSAPGIDSAAISAHKLQGPRGIGLLYVAHRIEPFIRGGGQEGGIRPGTENLAGAVALSRCLEKCGHKKNSCTAESPVSGTPPELASGAESVMAHLVSSLTAIGGVSIIPGTRTPADARFSPYVVQFTNAKLPGEVLVRALSDKGIFISTGSACSSKKKNRPVLQAMHVSPDMQQNAFRISIGNATTTADIDALTQALKSVFAGI